MTFFFENYLVLPFYNHIYVIPKRSCSRMKTKRSCLIVFIGNMWLTNHLSVLIACLAHASYTLECEQNQSGQSMSFFKTNGDLSLTGKIYYVHFKGMVFNTFNLLQVSLTFTMRNVLVQHLQVFIQWKWWPPWSKF